MTYWNTPQNVQFNTICVWPKRVKMARVNVVFHEKIFMQ